MPQTVIKLKYTTARRICKAIFRQAPRAAVFPDDRRGRAPPRASCFAKRPEQLPVRSQTIGLSAHFRLPGNFNNRNGNPADRCLRIGARISGAFGKKKRPPRFCKRFAQADAQGSGHALFREPLNKSSAALSGPFAPAYRFENLEIRKGFLRFPNLNLEQNPSLTTLAI